MPTINLVPLTTTLLAAMVVCCAAVMAQPPTQKDVYNYEAQQKAPPKTRRIVFIASKADHGPRGNHEFFAGSLYLARQINARYPGAYAVVYDEKEWPKDLSKADAIVVMLNHGGPAAADPNIKAAVARGAGFMAVHFGVEVNKGEQGNNYLSWIGGYFETFWSVNPFWVPEFAVDVKHPVAQGVKPFQIRDEWYYHMRFQPEMKGVTPILSAKAPANSINYTGTPSERGGNPDVQRAIEAGEPQVLAWAYQRPDKGRGFGFTGFHDYYNLTNDSFRSTLLNAVAWVSGLNVPKNGVPSATPTRAELDALMAEAHRAQ